MSKLVIPAGMGADRQSLAHRLRRMLHQEGRLPGGVLPASIEASWRRSLAHGVDCSNDTLLCPGHSLDPKALLDQHRPLLNAARQELDLLAARHGRDRVVILADGEARVLSVMGRTDRMAGLGMDNLRLGSCSSEALCGTNALGTVLEDRAPVLIDVGEHFLDCLSAVSCAAVPIHDPQGRLAAVLDITQAGALTHPQPLLADLANAASRVEARWFGQSYPDDLVLAFHSHHPFLSTHWRGIMVVDPDGRLRAVNGQASALLNLSREQLQGLDCGSVFGQHWPALSARLRQDSVIECGAPGLGWFIQALRVPQRPLAVGPGAFDARARQAREEKPLLPATVTGASPVLAQSLRRALRGLDRDVPVLLLGETGTGKEVTARALHEASARAGKPFVAINCAAIPEGLIESELFGYAPGAFTGARRGGTAGRLMQAHGGTLFLDEIGDMPVALQTRLLRVLQERRVAPLGGGAEQPLDVALICATHRDLKAMVGEARFREDLFYRIDGFSVRLLPLRERSDLDALIDALLDRLGAPGLRLHPELRRLFALHPWPGNVRQLDMVLRTALAVREDDEDEIDLQHLGAVFREELLAADLASHRQGAVLPEARPPERHAAWEDMDRPGSREAGALMLADDRAESAVQAAREASMDRLARATPAVAPVDAELAGESGSPPVPEVLSLRDHEQALIGAALSLHQGNVSAAAQALGIGRATLYRKLQRMRG